MDILMLLDSLGYSLKTKRGKVEKRRRTYKQRKA